MQKDILRQRLKYIVSDYVTLNTGWLAFNIVRFYSLPDGFFGIRLGAWLCYPPLVTGQILVPLIMVAIYSISGYYNLNKLLYKSRLDEFLNTVTVSFIGMLGIYFTALINDNIPERLHNYELMLVLFFCLSLPPYIARVTISSASSRAIRRGDYSFNTLVAGTTADALRQAHKIMATSARTGMNIRGFIDVSKSGKGGSRYSLGGMPVYCPDDTEALCRSLEVKAIIMVPDPEGMDRTVDTINKLYQLGMPVYIPPDLYHLIMMRPRFSSVVTEPLVDITRANIPASTMNLKRLGDIIISSLALICLSPVYAAIALAVRMDSPGPVFYLQERMGWKKKIFKIIKFRTMYIDAESTGPALSTPGDTRITRTGHFLRKYRLDELPQFWNVLIGQMSLVGPRPERKFYVDQIVHRLPAYSLIHQVRPGVTSWGMVKFGYASNVDEMIERLRYDLLYLENVSLSVDLKILFHTISTVFTGKGV